MKGAIVFLLVFVIFLVATLGYPAIPPRKTLYQLLGIPATSLVQAIINGVTYGAITWLIFSLTMKYKKESINDTAPF